MKGCYRSPYIAAIVFLFSVFGPSAHAGTIVTRPGTSAGDCAAACLKEKEIDCRYFKFKKSKSLCILTPVLDPGVNGLIKVEKPAPASNSEPASIWLSQIQARILALEQRNIDMKVLHKSIVDLKAEVTGLKNSRALTHHLLRTTKETVDQNIGAVDEKVEVLKAESKRVEDAVMTLGDLEKTLGAKIRKVNEAQRETSLTTAMLSQSSKDARGSLRSLSEALSAVKEDVSAVRKSVTELEVRFASLSTDVMEKVSSFDAMIGPEMKEFRASQTTLGEALNMLTKKIMTMAPMIPQLERKLDQKLAALVEVEKKSVNLKQQLVLLNDRLGFVETQLKSVLDPLSKKNVEQRTTMTEIRKSIVVLENKQKKLQTDIIAEIAERSNLFKQISDLRVSRQAVVDKVVLVEKAIKGLREALRRAVTEGPNGRLMSNVLKRQVAVLKSLKALRNTQAEVQDALNTYKTDMLKTHRLLLNRDQNKIKEEIALGQLKAKLVKVYAKMKAMADRVPPAVMATLVDQQKTTLARVQEVRKDQVSIRRRLTTWEDSILRAKAYIRQQIAQEKADKAAMDALNVRVARLNARLNKMGKIPPGSLTALARLQDLVRSQKDVSTTLSTYRERLLQTQEEIRRQKERQLKEAEQSLLLRHELAGLHNTLNRVVGSVVKK